MKRSVLLLGVVAVVAVLSVAVASPAQTAAFSLGAGVGAEGYVSDGTRFGGVFAVADRGIFASIPGSEPVVVDGQFACASMEGSVVRNGRPRYLQDFGCGTLTLTIDPLLNQARMQGVIDSELYNASTGRFLRASKLTIDMVVTGDGDHQPNAFQFAGYFPGTIDAAVGAGVYRGGTAGGTMTSRGLGTLAGGESVYGSLFETAGVYVSAYDGDSTEPKRD